MAEEEAREELRARCTAQTQREEKRQKVIEIAQQENISLEHCDDVMSTTTLSNLHGGDMTISANYDDVLCQALSNERKYQAHIEMNL